MRCVKPLFAWQFKNLKTPNGKALLSFKNPHANYSSDVAEGILLPCGRCIKCKLERSKVWAYRCMFEADMYEENSFITLTYNDQFLPIELHLDGSLRKRHFSLFMKKLRKVVSSATGQAKRDRRVRYFMCGEYGELCKKCGNSRDFCGCRSFEAKLGRPHYHACLFNFSPEDKELYSVRNGVRLYRSKMLEDLWSDPKTKEKYGYVTVGDVTFESAAYVARYCTKKITGEKAKDHYEGRVPEYVNMSTGRKDKYGNTLGGIGYSWLKKYKEDVYNYDSVVIRGGIKCRPARYFDKILEKDNPEEYNYIKDKRKERDVDPEMLDARRRQVVKYLTEKRVKQLKRGL